MKTIRQNVFETNSSSTHAISLNRSEYSGAPVVGLLPSETPYILRFTKSWCPDPDNTMTERLRFMVGYLLFSNQKEKLDKILEALGKLFQRQIVVESEIEPCEWGSNKDWWQDTFSWFQDNYRVDIDSTHSMLEEWFKNENSAIRFVCSEKDVFEIESYYDG